MIILLVGLLTKDKQLVMKYEREIIVCAFYSSNINKLI